MNVVVVVGAVLHKLLSQQLTFPRFKTGRLDRLDTAVQMFSDMQPLTGTEVLIPDGTVDKNHHFRFFIFIETILLKSERSIERRFKQKPSTACNYNIYQQGVFYQWVCKVFFSRSSLIKLASLFRQCNSDS